MGDEPLEGGEGPDAGAGSETETEYPKAPGASKMEALRRIERSLEDQTERTRDRDDESDARKADSSDESDAEPSDGDDATGDSPA